MRKKTTPQRILVCRTDRIGDVILSTPVLAALRAAFPDSFIACLVAPHAVEIIEGNPAVDEVLVDDKHNEHRSFFGMLQLIRQIRQRRFDTALILHSTNRINSIAVLSGIPRRIGWKRKMGWLLTEGLPYAKKLGERHEIDYNFDLARHIGVEPAQYPLHITVAAQDRAWAQYELAKNLHAPTQPVVVMHPGASCPSKRWPAARFAAVADRLSCECGVNIVLVAGPRDIAFAQAVEQVMKQPCYNLAGKTTIRQLTALLERSAVFLSNDSGPVHCAVSVATPVIAIFGRNQPGLSPLRWGPVGRHDRVFHKDTGCPECYAHNCRKQFACLMAITPDEVFEAAVDLLQQGT